MLKSRQNKNLPASFLVHNLGLGDHILCKGIYKGISIQSRVVMIVVKLSNLKSLKQLLGDLENVYAIPLPSSVADRAQRILSRIAALLGFQVKSIGVFGKRLSKTTRFDEEMYLQAGVPFSQRSEGFSIVRNAAREEELFQLLGCQGAQYVFLHEDMSRGYKVDRKILPTGVMIIEAAVIGDFTIFDYIKVLENALEIHVIQSSFAALADCMLLEQKKVAHLYARPDSSKPEFEMSFLGEWELLR